MCAVSNPCFELWLVLHFKDQNAHVDNAAIQHMLHGCGCGYDKDRKRVDFPRVWAQRDEAIERADALDIRQRRDHVRVQDRNPWTSVHTLVVELIKVGDAQLGH